MRVFCGAAARQQRVSVLIFSHYYAFLVKIPGQLRLDTITACAEISANCTSLDLFSGVSVTGVAPLASWRVQ